MTGSRNRAERNEVERSVLAGTGHRLPCGKLDLFEIPAWALRCTMRALLGFVDFTPHFTGVAFLRGLCVALSYLYYNINFRFCHLFLQRFISVYRRDHLPRRHMLRLSVIFTEQPAIDRCPKLFILLYGGISLCIFHIKVP